MEFFATCPTGFEHLLADELERMGVPRVRPLQGQVAFEGALSFAYRACLRSHLASRVIAVIARIDAADSDELYAGANAIEWERHLPEGRTFAISASGTNAQLKNTQFVALRIKDAIVDRVLATRRPRPDVSTKRPDVHIVARLSKARMTLGIDLAGIPLFMRGYRQMDDSVGLRPDYAAALLELCGWQTQTPSDDLCLVDASPRPSTLLVEGCLLATGHAPGLLRTWWGCEGWGQHDPSTWDDEVELAKAQIRTGASPSLLTLSGKGPHASRIRSALRSSGIDPHVSSLTSQDASLPAGCTVVVCDLSSMRDEDLAQEASAIATTMSVAQKLEAHVLATASHDTLPDSFVGHEPKACVQTRMGQQSLHLESFELAGDQHNLAQVELSQAESASVLVPASNQFAARLKKVARLRRKWARREDVTCYRVYDTDLPDYAVSIDLYQGTDPSTGLLDGRRWLLVSEYAAPKDVDAALAKSRLVDVLSIAPKILDVEPRNVFLRVRRREKGGSQYAQEAKRSNKRQDKRRLTVAPGGHLIDEGGLTFEVNFSSYLDCGIFLDHRVTRSMLREMAKQTKGSKRFLNLFAYTGTATCYAADGGMHNTTTVDLSRTYLDWARRNMAHNGFTGPSHEFVQADVVRWVNEQRHTRNRWDLVFCDVPTFSNSSRMGSRSFDVQRDHVELLIDISRLLTRDGTCVFSCNLRSFVPDEQKLDRAGVVLEDITEQTIPEDFARNARIHHAYIVRRG